MHVATSVVHSKLDYCNSLYHNLPKSEITRLQQIQNSPARAVVKASKSSHITPNLWSLHWLKITERIEYKFLSLTYKVLTTTQPSYLHNLITVQPPRSTRSSSLVTLVHPHHLLYEYASPRLWNQLPASLRQPRTNLPNSASPSFLHGTSSISSIYSPLSSSITPSLFHSSLKTFLFCRIFKVQWRSARLQSREVISIKESTSVTLVPLHR